MSSYTRYDYTVMWWCLKVLVETSFIGGTLREYKTKINHAKRFSGKHQDVFSCMHASAKAFMKMFKMNMLLHNLHTFYVCLAYNRKNYDGIKMETWDCGYCDQPLVELSRTSW